MTFKPTFTLQTYNLNSTFEIKFKNISRLLSYLSLTNKNHQHLISDSITNQVYFAGARAYVHEGEYLQSEPHLR